MTEKRYITTTLPYVNADPHIGHAIEFVQADALARLWRLQGHEVFFSTGTDEHGQKIAESAEKAGQEPQEYVDYYAERFKSLKEELALSNDAFIRTTDQIHQVAAAELWRRCDAAGDIYKDTFEGLYCVGCEKYLTERDLVDGRCPLHSDREPEKVKEENYFFRFSKYTGELTEYLEKEGSVVPEARRKEALEFVAHGLSDFSISRQKSRVSWGIPVPEDSDHVMYVWFDALTNYISTLGWPCFAEATQDKPSENLFEKFWVEGETLQVAGKDQVRFQSLMWVAMLMSADIRPTDTIFYHGFVTSDGVKMSKSLGNVISPIDLVEKYGTDAVRYYLLRHIHPTEDSDITEEKFVDAYNGNLANGLGNVVARVMKMAEDHGVEYSGEGDVSIEPKIAEAIEHFQFNDALDVVWENIQSVDQRITEEEPFKVIKEDVARGREMIQVYVQDIYRIAHMLSPFLPETAEKIKKAVETNTKPETLFPRH